MTQKQSTGTQNAGQVINDVMQSIDALHAIYAQENEILDRADSNGFMALQPEKTQRINLYKDHLATLMQRRDEAKQADPMLKKKLQAKQVKFAELCEVNLKGLKKMKRGSERLGDKIRFCAKEAARQQGRNSYGENGFAKQSSSDKTLSIGISETA